MRPGPAGLGNAFSTAVNLAFALTVFSVARKRGPIRALAAAMRNIDRRVRLISPVGHAYFASQSRQQNFTPSATDAGSYFRRIG